MKDVSLMIGDIKFNYRVGVMLLKDENMLIEVSPNDEHVVVPGGRVKTNESSKEALKRELEEELNFEIDLKRLKLSGVFENFFVYDNTNCHEIFILYKYKLDKDELNDNFLVNYDSKNNYYKWINIEELKDINLLPTAIKKCVNSNKINHFINK